MKHQPVPKDDLRERFILFLAGKPADQRYDWHDVRHCACGTFVRQHCGWRDRAAVWNRWNMVALHCDTYGELLKRVQEV